MKSISRNRDSIKSNYPNVIVDVFGHKWMISKLFSEKREKYRDFGKELLIEYSYSFNSPHRSKNYTISFIEFFLRDNNGNIREVLDHVGGFIEYLRKYGIDGMAIVEYVREKGWGKYYRVLFDIFYPKGKRGIVKEIIKLINRFRVNPLVESGKFSVLRGIEEQTIYEF